MVTTLYIIKEADAYRFGFDPVVRFFEPESASRAWIRRLTVELPAGFYVTSNVYDEPMIFCDGEHYEIGTNKAEEPVIIDHKSNGCYIPLSVLCEGWD